MWRQHNRRSTLMIRKERNDLTIERIKVGPRMSQAVIHGDTVYLAGQVADDPSADVADQTRQILAKIDGLLAKPARTSRRRYSPTCGCPTSRPSTR